MYYFVKQNYQNSRDNLVTFFFILFCIVELISFFSWDTSDINEEKIRKEIKLEISIACTSLAQVKSTDSALKPLNSSAL